MLRSRQALSGVCLLLTIVGCANERTASLSYADLLTELEAGNIESAELSAEAITVVVKVPPRVAPASVERRFRVVLPSGENERNRLIAMLTEHKVDLIVRE